MDNAQKFTIQNINVRIDATHSYQRHGSTVSFSTSESVTIDAPSFCVDSSFQDIDFLIWWIYICSKFGRIQIQMENMAWGIL